MTAPAGMQCQWDAGAKHHLLLLEGHQAYERQLCTVDQQNSMQAANSREGGSCQGYIEKEYWD